MLDRIVGEQAECWIAGLIVTALVFAGLALKGAAPADPDVAAQLAVQFVLGAAGMFGDGVCAGASACVRI